MSERSSGESSGSSGSPSGGGSSVGGDGGAGSSGGGSSASGSGGFSTPGGGSPGGWEAPRTPIGVRRPWWIPVGIGVLSVAIVVVLALLVFGVPGNQGNGGADTIGDSGAATTTRLDEDGQRAAVVAAVEVYFRKLDEAYASNDFAVVQGLYVPDSEAARTQQETIQGFAEEGVISRGTTSVEVRSVDLQADRAEADVRITISMGQFVDEDSGEVLTQPADPASEDVVMVLKEVDGEWLLEAAR